MPSRALLLLMHTYLHAVNPILEKCSTSFPSTPSLMSIISTLAASSRSPDADRQGTCWLGCVCVVSERSTIRHSQACTSSLSLFSIFCRPSRVLQTSWGAPSTMSQFLRFLVNLVRSRCFFSHVWLSLICLPELITTSGVSLSWI